MIEIARNLIADDLKILICDEPTSSLSEQEVRIEEIMQIGDYVAILRDGKFVASAAVGCSITSTLN